MPRYRAPAPREFTLVERQRIAHLRRSAAHFRRLYREAVTLEGQVFWARKYEATRQALFAALDPGEP